MKKQILLSVMAVSMFALLSASSKQSVDGDQTTKAAIANAKNLSKEGVVVNMFPPGNDGSERGAGIVRENDGTNRGAEFVFQTPQDVETGPIAVGQAVHFRALNQRAKEVSAEH
jgi:hypothetical protein